MSAEQYTLREKQSLFAKLLAQLITWIFAQGWEVTLGEGFVGITDGKDFDHDGPHMRSGAHYTQLGQDLNLFVSGKYITGHHPAWDAIGAQWKSYHGLCRWGGDFPSRDYNHVSLYHQGRA